MSDTFVDEKRSVSRFTRFLAAGACAGLLAACTTTQQAAVTDRAAATPGLRTITRVIPQARLLSTLKKGATGSYPFVGGAQAEVKLTDSMTGEILVAGVDRRIGGGNISTAAQWEWGDAENVMKEWAKLAVERLSAWTKGTAKPA